MSGEPYIELLKRENPAVKPCKCGKYPQITIYVHRNFLETTLRAVAKCPKHANHFAEVRGKIAGENFPDLEARSHFYRDLPLALRDEWNQAPFSELPKSVRNM